MIKKIVLLLAAAMIFTVTGAPAFADSGHYIGVLCDKLDAFPNENEDDLIELLECTAAAIEMNVGVVAENKIVSSEEKNAKNFCEENFGAGTDSIVLVFAPEGSGDVDYIYMSGRAYDVFDPQLGKLYDAVYYGYNSGASPNYTLALTQFCEYLLTNVDGYVSDVKDGITYMAVLEDYQDALSYEEETELLQRIQEAADYIGANVGVVLTNGLDGQSSSRFTDNFLDTHFGENSSSVVLMLVKSGTGEEDWLSFTKDAYDIYYPKTKHIFNAVYRGLDRGGDNYPEAIKEFCNYLEVNRWESSSGSSGSSFHLNAITLFGLLFSLVLSFVIVSNVAARYKKKALVSARAYLDNSMTRFTEKKDVFVREYTTSCKVSSSSGGGGRSGGGGGRSHSGSRGGGGGRRR